jgi:hypothetical protein
VGESERSQWMSGRDNSGLDCWASAYREEVGLVGFLSPTGRRGFSLDIPRELG